MGVRGCTLWVWRLGRAHWRGVCGLGWRCGGRGSWRRVCGGLWGLVFGLSGPAGFEHGEYKIQKAPTCVKVKIAREERIQK